MLTREMFIRGFMRVELDGFKEAIKKAKDVVEKIETEDVLNKPVIYFQISPDRTILRLKIYDEDNGLKEIGSAEIIEFAGEGEYRDIEIRDVSDIYDFINQFEKESSLDGVICMFFSVKKVIINVDNDCLIVY